MKPIREVLDQVLDELGQPEAEVIDLRDYFVSRRIRRELEQEKRARQGGPDEPPEAA